MYHPPSPNYHNFFENQHKAIDAYKHYQNVLLVGDFNAEILGVC